MQTRATINGSFRRKTLAERVGLTRAFGPRPAGAVAKPPASSAAAALSKLKVRTPPRPSPFKYSLVAKIRPTAETFWRRGWDSNPRTRLGVTHFPGVRLRPLGHLSSRPQGYRSGLSRSNPQAYAP